jgi:hypothetical protein
MPDFFTRVLGDVNELQEDLLGPNYDYWKNVNTPSEIGMSSDGNLSTLATDVEGLISYVELLVTGSGKASKTGKPLGNKFFLETGGKCKVKGSDDVAKRYIYINNVPTGSIPFISSGLGMDFSDFRGLIPGLMSNVTRVNPLEIFQSFMMPAQPECQELTMEVIDSNNNVSEETHYVATMDIKNMDPCQFPEKRNPVTGKNCVEAMSNMNPKKQDTSIIPDDTLTRLYMLGISGLGLYVLYRLMSKKK